ncbi:MAG: hypothetical protein ACK579_19095 [Dolichospermum sp.]|jgi:hypothetical protein|nr:hypothetical protein [Dolichospermum circinale Clear-D4]
MSNKFNERGNHNGDNVGRDKNTIIKIIIKIIPQIPGKIFKSAVFGIILGFVVIAVSKLMGTNGEGAGIAQLLGAIIMGGYIFVTYWNKLTRMRRFVILIAIPIAIPMITCFVYPIIREMLANFILNCSTTIPQCNNTSNEAITYPLSYAIICLLFDIFIDVWSRKSENK